MHQLFSDWGPEQVIPEVDDVLYVMRYEVPPVHYGDGCRFYVANVHKIAVEATLMLSGNESMEEKRRLIAQKILELSPKKTRDSSDPGIAHAEMITSKS